jgi:hypothetical protein
VSILSSPPSPRAEPSTTSRGDTWLDNNQEGSTSAAETLPTSVVEPVTTSTGYEPRKPLANALSKRSVTFYEEFPPLGAPARPKKSPEPAPSASDKAASTKSVIRNRPSGVQPSRPQLTSSLGPRGSPASSRTTTPASKPVVATVAAASSKPPVKATREGVYEAIDVDAEFEEMIAKSALPQSDKIAVQSAATPLVPETASRTATR